MCALSLAAITTVTVTVTVLENFLMLENDLLKKQWTHFLSPRYWLTWLILGFLRLCAVFPYSVLLFLGKTVGYLFMWCIPKRRKVTTINLALCFPDLNILQRKKMLHDCFKSAGIGLLEMGLAWWGSDTRLKKMVHVNGLKHLNAAKTHKTGVLVATCHFTSIELGIRLLSFCTPINVMYRPQDNELFEWMLQKRRSRYVREGITRKDIRGMLRALKQTDAIMCYTPDQDMGRDSSVFAPFFGILASTVVGTNYFIKKTGSVLLPGFYYRHEKEQRYSLNFLPVLDNFPSGDNMADATRINKIIEEAILLHPEQYMWQHRRFKTRPEGEVVIY